MLISILTPDLSHNCLGRAYLLAKILQKRYDVNIIGPSFREGIIWEPVGKLKDMQYITFPIKKFPASYRQMLKLSKKIKGDVIYASKPLFTSFGIGKLQALIKNIPLVLDIDDWELGFILNSLSQRNFLSNIPYLAMSAVRLYGLDSYFNSLLGEKLSKSVDEITVSNEFLKKRFGGTIIYHCRNTNVFNPELYDKQAIRKMFNIDINKKVIMFAGSLDKHKGVEDLVNAINIIKDVNVLLIVVGINKSEEYSIYFENYAKNILKERFIGFGLLSFDKLPMYIAMADVYVIPQLKNFASYGQIPAKVFDAMAMGKPIIATNISDLPFILKGCGWIVEPGNIKELSDMIKFVINNLEEANLIGLKARSKCIKYYSWQAMEKIMFSIFDKYS